MTLRRRGDTLIKWPVGPTNEIAGTVIDQTALTAAGGSHTVRLYEAQKSARVAAVVTSLRSAAAALATDIEIPIFTPAIFEIGDTLTWVDSTGTTRTHTISTVTPSSTHVTLTISPAVVVALDAGHKISLSIKASGTLRVALVPGPESVEIGDVIEVECDDLSLEMRTVSDIAYTVATETPAGSSATASDAVNQDEYFVATVSGSTAAVSPGRRVRVKIGGDLTGAEYGTVLAGSDQWGFSVTVPDTLDLPEGSRITVEGDFDAGAGLRLLERWTEKVE